jgi:molybdopterin-containing oxidoreductase family iron-sulfur binding subunit
MSTEAFVPLSELRRRAADSGGTEGRRRYWKSLEELAESPGFTEFLHREFPQNASEWQDPAGRRDFMRLMGASVALAGLTACTRQPEEKIVPHVKAPEEMVPGRALYFATAVSDHGYAKGVLVESHEGRPTKIEGNPEHPSSLGKSDLHTQAQILALYDPDRSQALKQRGEIRPWGAFLSGMRTAMEAQKAIGGEGFRILTETVTSPTLIAQIEEILAGLPKAKWIQWEPAGRDQVRAGAKLAFGQAAEPVHALQGADVIVSLDADFLASGPASVRLLNEFSKRRKVENGPLNRLYVVESFPTSTGSVAEHRRAVKPSEVEGMARAIAAGLGLPVAGAAAGAHAKWVAALVADLQAHAGRSVVIAGDHQPPAVHALAHAINEKLGNVGVTVRYLPPATSALAHEGPAALAELANELEAGKVDVLLVVGANPVYTAPAELEFGRRILKAFTLVHAGLHEDETGELAGWHVPLAHSLESWSDLRAEDGTVSIVQPLIAPLYSAAHPVHEVVGAFAARQERKAYDAVRGTWKDRLGLDFEKAWRKAVHDGVVAGQAPAPLALVVQPGEWMSASPKAVSGLEVAFRPDPAVDDGRFANNGWLQELPKPMTKVTWENVVHLSPATAEKMGLRPGKQTARGLEADVVEVILGGKAVRGPAWIVPGHADDTVTLNLGYGRTKAGRVGTGIGYDAFTLRTSAGLWSAPGVAVRQTGERVLVAGTQDHWTIEAHTEAGNRHLVRAFTADEYAKDPGAVQKLGHDPAPTMTMFEPHKYEGHAWGMTIDLASCVGCNACVVACVAENNIPVVGKEQVAFGREMQWLRVDRYYEGAVDDPGFHHQPVPCMHCENAPCEQVCPVAATVHSDEGLNDMVYNRCVGTRYCSNNCPYKVRRFNFYLYQDWETPSLKLMRNPDVSIRSRGVMEKCTYCVQRINRVRIDARNEGRDIKDGEIQTACQQACPAEAIVFGDVNDPQSRVSKLKATQRNYGILTDLNTRPRTTYLAEIRNPNPALKGGGRSDSSHG